MDFIYYKNFFKWLLFSLVIGSFSIINAQMPAHPNLLQKIQTDKTLQKSSYYLMNQTELKAKGIDAPWSSSQLQIHKSKGIQNTFSRSYGKPSPPHGNWNALVILVQFSDKPKQVNPTYFDNLLFGTNSGTLNSYYKAVSYNNLDIVTVNLPSSMGWQTAPHNYSYYCNGQHGFGNYPQNAQKLVEDAVTLAEPLVDFSKYDNDADGYVDALFVIHSGPGAEFTGNNNDIWSHEWTTSYEINVNGVKVSRYSMEPEYWSNPGDMTIGVYAHELGHAAFGLPDLYDTDYSSSGLGYWSIMSTGSWGGNNGDSPSFPDAWSQIQMGYVTPTVISSTSTNLSLGQVETTPQIFLLWENGVSGNEYFLVENREKTSFDKSLPNSGLNIYHVDESVTTGNDNEWYPGYTSNGHYLVALEQADGLWNLEHGTNRGDIGDPYPGTANYQNFSNSTTPDSKDYLFNPTGIAVNNISVSGQNMTADYILSFSSPKVITKGDTTWIPGGTFNGAENAGLMETTINGDINSDYSRKDPNRVYALYEGQVYYQLAPINVNNPAGTLTIEGVPDPSNPAKTTKPIIVIKPTNGQPVVINGGGTNEVYGSIKLVNIHYQTMQLDGTQNNELFYCGTANNLPQSLTIDNCLFEFSNIDLFDCTNESGAIGGWPYGAKFKITNSYFRNMFNNGQWWGSRVFQCKHPIDTLWVENSTFATGGLLFLQQNQLADFVYINHNTIVNTKKYWLLSAYRHEQYITNNIFINQNWVGEDTNVTSQGLDPDKLFMSTIDIDTNIVSNGNGLQVQPKYWLNGNSTKFTSDLALNNINIYISNNINYDSPELSTGYYNNPAYVNAALGTLPSFLQWIYPGIQKVKNIPGMWMNSRTKALFIKYAPPNGGFFEENTITTQPQTATPVTLDANTITAMAQWNQYQWEDPNFTNPTPNILSTNYIYGDYNPTTLPGIINGLKSDAVKGEAAGTQVGITKFTDLSENFYQTANTSTIDNLPIGSLIWNDAAIKAYNSKDALNKVMTAYGYAKQSLVFNTNITISENGNNRSQLMTFGTSTTATDGIDPVLGESLLPPVPPSSVFDTRFIFPDGISGSLIDYRKNGQDSVTWVMTFQPGKGGYPITFTWDKTTLPNDGSYILTDAVTGTIVNIDMRANNSYTLTNTGIKSLLIKYCKKINVNVVLSKDWNMISMPVTAANMGTTVLFPNFTSQTYSYSGGYQIVTALGTGQGYWIKYKNDTTIAVSGKKVNSTTIPVKNGWNMTGVYDWSVLVSGITTTPTGIISSQFYGYNNGYVIPPSLSPGQGYWIKVTSDGVLNLPAASSSSQVASKFSTENQKDALIFNVSDAEGKSAGLRLLKDIAKIEKYDLPPMPPKGIYDIRWSSDRNVEKRSDGIKVIEINSASYPVTLSVTGGDVRVKDLVTGQIINQILKNGETLNISDKSIDRLTVEDINIPTEFKLLQNYPNPFNPETKIEYWLPSVVKVTLKIYDVLGREIETLVDKMQDAGKYEVNWNAARYSSGVYFYNITAGSNHSVKKMLLVK